MRVVVVGASTGLGRCIGVGLAQRGAKVVLMARRQELLDAAAVEAGPDARGITCDVTDPESCRAAIAQAVSELGGIDGIVYATGMGALRHVEDLDPATWHQLFDTNVVGANSFTAAALPHLVASGGAAAYLSSISASLTAPWPGLAAYNVTKAALDKLIEAWRSEHPHVGFTRVVVGEAGGGEGDSRSHFGENWDLDLVTKFHPVWTARGLVDGSLIDVDVLIELVDTVLRIGASASIPSVTAIPRRPALDFSGGS
jgi:NAD(P)-dependent dehydrogenase (short-subunit alcohol dehydrogenase family)